MAVEQVVLFIIALGVVFFWYFNRKPNNFPRGPIGLPVVGYLPLLGKYPFKTITKLGEKYGNVFSIPMGPRHVVVLNDWPAIKEAFINQAEAFSGRDKNVIYEEATHYANVILSDGPEWKERRRFTIHHLNHQGLGKSRMEAIISEEIQSIYENLAADNGKVIEVDNYFFIEFMNIVWVIVAGKRIDKDDETVQRYMKVMKEMFIQTNNTNPIFFMPYLRHLFRKKYQKFQESSKLTENFIRKEINEHIATYQDGCVRDFLDAYLSEIFKKEKSGDKSKSFQIDNVVQISKDLLNAGIDTSHNTLLFGLLYMATWPSIQQKVQDEMDKVIGRERLPNYKDRFLLNYTHAVVLEVLRYSTIAPLAILHTTTSEVKLLGWTIPKDTIIIPNVWNVHRDAKFWKDPEIFRPERFFNAEGEVKAPEYLIPFSVGARSCLGESLGKMNSFLVLSCLLHRFTFSLLTGEVQPTLDPVYRIILCPENFYLQVNQR